MLVIGPGRGGTGLLAALLDAHPRLDVELENHSKHLLIQKREPRQRLRLYRERCERRAETSDAQIWGNKVTTESIRALAPDGGIEPLDLFFGELSDIPTIFILRDGRSCVESKVRRTGMPYEKAADNWRFSVDAMQYLQARGALVVTFEQLVTEPERTLKTVCSFLTIPFSERMYEGTTSLRLNPEYRRERISPDRAAVAHVPPKVYESIVDALRAAGYIR